MNLGKTMASILALITVVLVAQVATAVESEDSRAQNKEYLSLLQYEYNNRVFAYLSMKRIAESDDDTPRAEFYRAYYDLEVLNKAIYQEMEESLGFDYRSGWFTRFKGWGVGLLIDWFDEESAQGIVDIVEPYMEKLKRLRDLSDAEQHAFFDYVVDQEQVQLDAARATVNNDWQSGAELFRSFMRENSLLKARAEQK